MRAAVVGEEPLGIVGQDTDSRVKVEGASRDRRTLLRRVFSAPHYDDPDLAGKAGVAWGIGWMTISLVLISDLFEFAFLPVTLRWIVITVMFVGIGVAILALVRMRRPTAAAWLFVVTFYAYAVGAAWTAGGLMAPSITAQMVFVAAAALLLGWRAGLGAAAVSAATLYGLAWAQTAGALPAPEVVHTPWTRANVLVTYVFAIYIVAAVVVRALVHARRTAERELEERRAAELLTEALIDSAPAIFYVRSAEGRLLRWNRRLEELTGLTAEELSGLGAFATVVAEDRNGFAAKVAEVAETGSGEYIARIATPDGPRDHLLTGRRVTIDGRPCVVGFGVDITDRLRAEEAVRALNAELESRVLERTEQLEEALRALESFSYSVAHDLRSPLRAINGYATLIEADYDAAFDQDGRHMLDRIRENTENMGQLIDDLLAFSRLRGQRPQSRLVDTQAVVASVCEEIGSEETRAHVQLDVGDLPAVNGDEAMLRQVWVNLLENAVKFSRTREAPRVEVRADRHAHEVVFVVRDNGVGFDPAYVDRLFTVFERQHGSEYEGTGIGLAICKRIVEAHGGRIWCTSEAGAGASFYFSLPAAATSGP